jgi:hypothetical protein
MNLLSTVAGSVLWLAEDNLLATQNLRAAAERGASPRTHRVRSTGPVRAIPRALLRRRSRAGHLSLYLSLHGKRCAVARLPARRARREHLRCARSGSILTHAGLADLITESPDAYERLAHALATEPGLLESVRSRVVAAPGKWPVRCPSHTPATGAGVPRARQEKLIAVPYEKNGRCSARVTESTTPVRIKEIVLRPEKVTSCAGRTSPRHSGSCRLQPQKWWTARPGNTGEVSLSSLT